MNIIDIKPKCILCGSKGELYYENMTDKLFESDGEWNLYLCSNNKCRLVWVYPQPSVEELAVTYKNYYTHIVSDLVVDKNKDSYSKHIIKTLHSIVLFLRKRGFNHKDYETKSYMYLGDQAPGTLLDIGCGNGDLMVRLKGLGWVVEGQEIDLVSVDIARKKGLQINACLINDLSRLAWYDAVTMSHVLEHLPNPQEDLKKCYEMLKYGGKLVITTPNSVSLGHFLFRSNWRGLEVPRHLYVFSCMGISDLLARAGFSKIQSFTTSVSADTFCYDSLFMVLGMSPNNHNVCKVTKYSIRFLAICYQMLCSLICRLFKYKGEECVIIATK